MKWSTHILIEKLKLKSSYFFCNLEEWIDNSNTVKVEEALKETKRDTKNRLQDLLNLTYIF